MEKVDQLREAAFIKIADRRIAVRLDPFGMLRPQIVVDLPLQLAVSSNLAREGLIWQRQNGERSGKKFLRCHAPNLRVDIALSLQRVWRIYI